MKINYELEAKKILTKANFDFVAGGAGNENTIRHNAEAFEAMKIISSVLNNVENASVEAVILNTFFQSFVGVSPTAFHKLMTDEGEIATAKATKAAGVPFIVSMMANIPLEELISINPNAWFQIYIFKNRDITRSLIQRAEAAGYKALVITVDAPIMGERPRDIENQFTLPAHLTAANLTDCFDINHMTLGKFVASQHDASVGWEDIREIQKLTKLPIILKGILNVDDAKKASRMNVAGIIVSNHGGRQLEDEVATIEVLPEIVAAVGKMPVFLDGGIGDNPMNAIKAIALGAQGVFLGRLPLYALATGGEQALTNFLSAFNEKLIKKMMLCGCENIAAIRENVKIYYPNRNKQEQTTAMAAVEKKVVDLEKKIDRLYNILSEEQVEKKPSQPVYRRKTWSL